MSIKCPKCNRSEDVVLTDGPEFTLNDEIRASFACESCDVSFRADFAIQLLDVEEIGL